MDTFYCISNKFQANVSDTFFVLKLKFLPLFPFPGREIEQAGEWRSVHLGWATNGENWGGCEWEGGGGVEKRNCLQSNPNILPNSVCPQTGNNSAIWLVSSPSIKKWHQKFDRSCIIWHLEHDNIKIQWNPAHPVTNSPKESGWLMGGFIKGVFK